MRIVLDPSYILVAFIRKSQCSPFVWRDSQVLLENMKSFVPTLIKAKNYQFNGFLMLPINQSTKNKMIVNCLIRQEMARKYSAGFGEFGGSSHFFTVSYCS